MAKRGRVGPVLCGYGARVSEAMFYSYFRSYSPGFGSYAQNDPKGLAAVAELPLSRERNFRLGSKV